MDLAPHSLAISQCEHGVHDVVLRCSDTRRRVAQQNQSEHPCFIAVSVTMALPARTVIMQNILKAFGGLLA